MNSVNISDFNRAPPAAIPPKMRQKRKRNTGPYSEMESLQKRVVQLQQGEIQSNLNQLKIIELLKGIKQDLENLQQSKQVPQNPAASNPEKEQVSASHVSVVEPTAVRSPESTTLTIAKTDSVGTSRLGVTINLVEEQVNTPETNPIAIPHIEVESSSSIPVVKENESLGVVINLVEEQVNTPETNPIAIPHIVKETGINEKTIKHVNDVTYVGSFEGEVFKEGTKSFQSGLVMSGKFDEFGLVEGKIIYPSGEMQEGNFKGNQLIIGKVVFPGKQLQEGKFMQGKIFNGKVTLLDKNIVYEGVFSEKGGLHEGKITFPDKVVAEGFFNENGGLEGLGKISLNGRVVKQGIFVDGNLE